ncbi:acyl dehydratase [Bradyrhizobium huanghuaihaiense]|uniref:Acyl dehydratase n=2 Tax=Bradyrhizobium huanghuaihaiense TaxID=990078 RepID=A0A562S5L5_9BRAD|nr:acyl dehydratase [Bradyrhizobium huanghuaihaiense]
MRAKRSNPDCLRGGSLDRFVASLLAMTGREHQESANSVACGRFNGVDARDKPAPAELNGLSHSSHRGSDRGGTEKKSFGMTDFDPNQHRMIPTQRWFEDFVVGERFVLPSRTQTSAVFAAFQTASGDTHPVHYDVEYCRSRGMPHLLAHGFQTLIHTAPGAGLFPFMVEDSLVGFLEQSSRFLKPVYADDTIYPALEVTELVPGRTTGVVTLGSTVFNQRKELVLEGMQKFLIRRRPG